MSKYSFFLVVAYSAVAEEVPPTTISIDGKLVKESLPSKVYINYSLVDSSLLMLMRTCMKHVMGDSAAL